MSEGSKFHSCGAETEKPLRPDRSFRYRGTRSWAWDDDRRLRLAGMSFTEWQSSIKYSGCTASQAVSRYGSLVCIEYETESEASEDHVELQPRSDRICQFWGSNVQQSWGPIGDGRGGRHLSHREGCWWNRLACKWRHGPKSGWLMMWASARTVAYLAKLVVARLAEFGDMILHDQLLINDKTEIPHGCEFS